MGRYIRLYADKTIPQRKAILYFITFQALILIGNIGMEHLMHKPCRVLSLDCSPFILGSAIAVFYYFKSWHFHSKMINSLSTSVLAVFLLDGMREWTNNYIRIQDYSSSSVLIIKLWVLVFSTFFLSLLVDKLRILLVGRLENNIESHLSKYISQLKNFVVLKLEKIL